MNAKLKIGIVGVGGIANGVHIPGLLRTGEVEIYAICDIDTNRLNEVGEKLGVPESRRFADYNALINCGVDAVEICTPNYLHSKIACAAVRAGKPINVEKPLDVNVLATQELENELKQHPVPNMMCFSYRFKPAVRYAKKILEDKLLGDIINVKVEYLKSSAFWEGRRLDWRFVKEYAGTGVLGDLGVHLIDMATFLVGDITEVIGRTATVVKERRRLDSEELAPVETDDTCSFLAHFECGATADFFITRCAYGNANTIKYDIYGTKGVLQFNLNEPNKLMVCIGKVDCESDGLHEITVPGKYALEQEQNFVNLLRGRETPYHPDITEGIKCQKILDAIYESEQEKRWITLK